MIGFNVGDENSRNDINNYSNKINVCEDNDGLNVGIDDGSGSNVGNDDVM